MTAPHSRVAPVAVVVPCRNEAAHIAALLDALACQTRPPDEIVIVDDVSTDTTVDVVRAWQGKCAVAVRVIDGPGKGPGPAMNRGIRETTATVIMRMDGHAVPAPDYLERCLDVLGSDDRRVGVVGGVWDVVAGADTAVARAIAAVVSHPLGSGGALYRHPGSTGSAQRSVETVPFGTFPRAVWDELGGFDESLSANQDFDFNYRARLAGFDVVLDRRIKARYSARPTLGSLARQYFRYGFWKVQMLRKDPRALHPRQLPPALVLPWIFGTMVLLAALPTTMTVALAALYPLVVLIGALHVAATHHVQPLAALGAMMTVHLTWSAGFWRGVVSSTAASPRDQSRT